MKKKIKDTLIKTKLGVSSIFNLFKIDGGLVDNPKIDNDRKDMVSLLVIKQNSICY